MKFQLFAICQLSFLFLGSSTVNAQQQSIGTVGMQDATVAGALEVSNGRAILVGNTTVTARDHVAKVELNRGGTCALVDQWPYSMAARTPKPGRWFLDVGARSRGDLGTDGRDSPRCGDDDGSAVHMTAMGRSICSSNNEEWRHASRTEGRTHDFSISPTSRRSQKRARAGNMSV